MPSEENIAISGRITHPEDSKPDIKHPDCCEAYTQEVTKFYQRLKELQEHIPARIDEIMQKLGTIEKQVTLQAGVIQGLSKGLANLTSQPNQSSQLKPADESDSKFPKIGKYEVWIEKTSKMGQQFFSTEDPETVKTISAMGKQAPQGYVIFPNSLHIANFFPPKRKW